MTDKKFDLLIIEDHPIVAEGLQKLILTNFPGAQCQIAGTGSRALAMLNGHHFEIILLDINLPDYNGVDLCGEIKSRFADSRIIALTSFLQRSYVDRMLKAGALGYLNKNADTDEILEAITQVMTGKTFFSQSVKDLLNNKSPDDSLSGKPSLSSREKQILALIVDGLTNQEIADKLFISLQTAISHRKNILIKFNAKNTAELVKLTLQSNYLE